MGVLTHHDADCRASVRMSVQTVQFGGYALPFSGTERAVVVF